MKHRAFEWQAVLAVIGLLLTAIVVLAAGLVHLVDWLAAAGERLLR